MQALRLFRPWLLLLKTNATTKLQLRREPRVRVRGSEAGIHRGSRGAAGSRASQRHGSSKAMAVSRWPMGGADVDWCSARPGIRSDSGLRFDLTEELHGPRERGPRRLPARGQLWAEKNARASFGAIRLEARIASRAPRRSGPGTAHATEHERLRHAHVLADGANIWPTRLLPRDTVPGRTAPSRDARSPDVVHRVDLAGAAHLGQRLGKAPRAGQEFSILGHARRALLGSRSIACLNDEARRSPVPVVVELHQAERVVGRGLRSCPDRAPALPRRAPTSTPHHQTSWPASLRVAVCVGRCSNACALGIDADGIFEVRQAHRRLRKLIPGSSAVHPSGIPCAWTFARQRRAERPQPRPVPGRQRQVDAARDVARGRFAA